LKTTGQSVDSMQKDRLLQ